MPLRIIEDAYIPPKYYVEVCRHDYNRDEGYRVASFPLDMLMTTEDIGTLIKSIVVEHDHEHDHDSPA